MCVRMEVKLFLPEKKKTNNSGGANFGSCAQHI